jgi:sulfatase maturation enzyme AslB (radical SAM superfamily)
MFKSASLNQDQISFSSCQENLRFHYTRGKGHLLRYLFNRLIWHFHPRFHIVTDFPEHVDLELSAACNMQCPMCYTITPEFKNQVKKLLMERPLWQKIVRECAGGNVFSLRLSLRGEPTLHPDFVEVVRYAKNLGIKEVSTLTNALRLTPEMFAELVDAGLDWLTISADGVGETYERIRRPARFADLLEKLRAFKEIKRSKGSLKPVIKVQSVWPAIQDAPQEYYDTFRPLVDQVSCNQLVDYLWQDHKQGLIKYRPDFDCHVLYQRLTVGADGGVMLCIYDELCHHQIGDLNAQTIYEVWHGGAMNRARRLHRQHEAISHFEACQRCPLPREMEVITTVSLDGREVLIDCLAGRTQQLGK